MRSSWLNLASPVFVIVAGFSAGCGGTDGASNPLVPSGEQGGASAAPPATMAPPPSLPAPPATCSAPEPNTSAVPPASMTAAVAANNAFAVSLYAQLRAGQKGNLITSPLSASLALTMAYAGAAGSTATEMAAALHLDGGGAASVFDGQSALIRTLLSRPAATSYEGSPGVACSDAARNQLRIIDSVWGERTYTWEPAFLNVLSGSYAAGLVLADFATAPDTVRGNIDDSVSNATSGAIENLLAPGSLDANTRMVLVNATYLKFLFASPFDTRTTRSKPFTRADGSVVSTPFMTGDTIVSMNDDGNATTVALPFEGGQLTTLLTKPYRGTSLDEYESKLSTGSAALTVPAGSQEVLLSVPRVLFKSKPFSLKAALTAMGMHRAFDPGTADFTGMCAHTPDRRPLYIGDVAQKAMLEMDETGVVAAASTAVDVPSISLAPTEIAFDQPYLVSIVDAPTGAVLFLGRIEDPTDAGGG